MKKHVDLLKGPVLSSLTRLAIPIMATSLIQMAYNLTDMIWIGRIGSDAVAAVGAAGMYMWLSNGLASLAKMGGQVNVGYALGSGILVCCQCTSAFCYFRFDLRTDLCQLQLPSHWFFQIKQSACYFRCQNVPRHHLRFCNFFFFKPDIYGNLYSHRQ